MTRNFIISICLALSVPVVAHAQGTPTKEQLDQAKKAFVDGKALHDEGKLGEAIEKFKESYRLSRNSVLLYNIALTLDENKQTDSALFYYRKFLSDAPPEAQQRKAATDRVKVLESEKLEADLNGKPPEQGKPETNTEPKPPTKIDTHQNIKIKPAGTYQASEFQHQVVEDAPPNKALDISAFVPEDSGWTVTLYYRGAGDASFVAKPMVWHYKQLIARIPSAKVSGSSIQYYVEVKDHDGAPVAKSGKATSPNLINIDASAQQHYFPDFTDDQAPVSTEPKRHHEDEDPLDKTKHDDDDLTAKPKEEPAGPAGEGYLDPGSKKFTILKWSTTAVAATFIATGVIFYVQAGSEASALADDSKTPHGTCTVVPCPFDSYDASLQSAGQRDQTISNIFLPLGIIGAGVAGYFWYRDLKRPHRNSATETKPAPSLEMTWMVTPTVGDHYQGAAAAIRF
jgi:hypothetical protein